MTLLNEYDKAEWFDVARKLSPGLTEDEYDQMWQRFVQAKADHEKQLGLH